MFQTVYWCRKQYKLVTLSQGHIETTFFTLINGSEFTFILFYFSLLQIFVAFKSSLLSHIITILLM